MCIQMVCNSDWFDFCIISSSCCSLDIIDSLAHSNFNLFKILKKVLMFANMFANVPSGDTFETFAVFNFMCVHERTLRKRFNVWWIMNNSHWSWKTFLETVLIQLVSLWVALKQQTTRNFWIIGWVLYIRKLRFKLGLKFELKLRLQFSSLNPNMRPCGPRQSPPQKFVKLRLKWQVP